MVIDASNGSELGLYYYGYRYYSPSLGRWITRDPIGEVGGKNLIGFSNNSPIVFYDVLGRTSMRRVIVGSNETAFTICEAVKAKDRETMLKRKRIGREMFGPLCDDAKNECDNMVENCKNNDPDLKAIWKFFSNEFCPFDPPIICHECENMTGAFDPGTFTINLCWNKIEGNPNLLKSVIWHEAIHAAQMCHSNLGRIPDANWGGKCKKSLKREIEAFYCTGACGTFEECMGWAIQSSCISACSSIEFVGNSLFEDMRKWYNEMESDNRLCEFPRHPNYPGVTYPNE